MRFSELYLEKTHNLKQEIKFLRDVAWDSRDKKNRNTNSSKRSTKFRYTNEMKTNRNLYF